MNRWLAGVLLVLSWVSPALADELQVRVLCYNIHHARGVDGKLDLSRIAGVIQSVSPHVVALQEVDRITGRSGRVDQPAELARLTGMNVVFEKNIDFDGGEYGNAVLSVWPIVRHENVHLPSRDGGEQRGVLMCELQPPQPRESVQFFCTHLDHRAADEERLASAARINELLAARGEAAAILAGDLNSGMRGPVLRIFSEKWQLANSVELPTIPVAEPVRQIDFILFAPRDRWMPLETRVLDEATASDHRPLFAVLELRPSARRPE